MLGLDKSYMICHVFTDDLLVAMQKEPGKHPDPLLWRSINCLQTAEQEELL